jgi:hypothetical protein
MSIMQKLGNHPFQGDCVHGQSALVSRGTARRNKAQMPTVRIKQRLNKFQSAPSFFTFSSLTAS